MPVARAAQHPARRIRASGGSATSVASVWVLSATSIALVIYALDLPFGVLPPVLSELDDVTEGGLPRGRPTLVWVPAGCGVTPS